MNDWESEFGPDDRNQDEADEAMTRSHGADAVQVFEESPEQTLLNTVGRIIESRELKRLIVLDDVELLTDNEIFDRLTGGGRLAVFEVSSSLQSWVKQRHFWGEEFRQGMLSSEEFAERVLDDMRMWGTEIFPQVAMLNVGFCHRLYLERLQREWQHVMEHLESQDWGRVVAALGFACDSRHQMLELVGIPAFTWPSRRSRGLERELSQIVETEYSLKGELFIKVNDLTVTQPDWAMLIGTQYEFLRPFPDQLAHWAEFNRIVDESWEPKPALTWYERFDYFQRSVRALWPCLLDQQIKERVRYALQEVEIHVRGTQVGQLVPDKNDLSQWALRGELDCLYQACMDGLRQSVLIRCKS